MKTQVTFRHMKAENDLNTAAQDAARKFEKFHDGVLSANVEFIDDTHKIVEFTVRLQGKTLVAKEHTDDFMKSLNASSDSIIRQIKKHKTKLNDHTPQIEEEIE
jgi:putative sigma-54 modulation protein